MFLIRRLGLWCLKPLSTLFQLHVYRGSHFFVEETGVPRKRTDPPPVTDKLYHIMLYRVHFSMSGIQTHNFNS